MEFNEKSVCVKCGCEVARVDYKINGDKDEYFLRSCTRCGYSWREEIPAKTPRTANISEGKVLLTEKKDQP